MKNSLVIGFVLTLAVIAISLGTRGRKKNGPSSPEEGQTSAIATRKQAATETPFPRFTWNQVESSSYQEYIQNLRRIGCPEQTVRDIVIADVNQLFDQKESNSVVRTNTLAYWKTGIEPSSLLRQQIARQHEQLETERKALLKHLLGDDIPNESRPLKITADEIAMGLLDFVPLNQRTQAANVVVELRDSFDSRIKPLSESGRGDDARAEYAKYVQERDDKLQQLLGSEGKREFEMRESPLAEYLRFRFQDVEFSEEEFRTLYNFAEPLRLNIDPLYSNYADETQRQSTINAQMAVWEKAKELLGKQRLQSRDSQRQGAAYGIK